MRERGCAATSLCASRRVGPSCAYPKLRSIWRTLPTLTSLHIFSLVRPDLNPGIAFMFFVQNLACAW